MKTAYSVGLFNWNIGIYLCTIAAIVLICVLVYNKKQGIIIKRYNLIFALFLLVSMVIMGLTNHYTQFYELKSRNYKIIEGKISHLKKINKGDEAFSVNGKDFIFNMQGDISQPFHLTDFVKELSDNKYTVKIYYSGEYILKVEYQ